MSYIKNVVIRNLTIRGVDGDIAVLGDNITSIISIDYYESIFEPTITFEILFVSIDNALTELKLRGTERVDIEIDHQSGPLSFEDLVITSFVQNESESTANTFLIRLEPIGAINTTKFRTGLRYDPSVPLSTHVTNILKSNIKATDDEIDVEETANSDGFYGNNWPAFKSIYFCARRSLSKSGDEEGSGTDRAGFLFWQVHNEGNLVYKFKSIDTIISEAKKNGALEYTQNDAISDNPNYDLYNPRWEFDQNIISQMHESMYGEQRRYYNVHTGQFTNSIPFSRSDAKQSFLGEEFKLDLDLDLNDDPTIYTINPIMDFTMRKDGTISDGGGEYNPHKIISQSRMRYASLLSSSLSAVVPLQTKLQAGDVISCKLINSMKGTDEWMSGLFLIRALRHTIHITDSGVECYTRLRLVRDTPGYA